MADSIAKFVLMQFDIKPSISTSDLIEKVQTAAKKSAFNQKVTRFQASHVAWYRYQIRKGIYQKRVKPATVKALALGKPQKANKAPRKVKTVKTEVIQNATE